MSGKARPYAVGWRTGLLLMLAAPPLHLLVSPWVAPIIGGIGLVTLILAPWPSEATHMRTTRRLEQERRERAARERRERAARPARQREDEPVSEFLARRSTREEA